MRIRIIPTNNLGCWAVPRTPASPTMPIANPAANPLKPTLRPAPKWTKALKNEKQTVRKIKVHLYKQCLSQKWKKSHSEITLGFEYSRACSKNCENKTSFKFNGKLITFLQAKWEQNIWPIWETTILRWQYVCCAMCVCTSGCMQIVCTCHVCKLCVCMCVYHAYMCTPCVLCEHKLFNCACTNVCLYTCLHMQIYFVDEETNSSFVSLWSILHKKDLTKTI